MFLAGILGFLPLLIFLFVVVSVVRAAIKMGKTASEQNRAPRSPAEYDPGVDDRTRRIQEEIRRKIAERRAGGASPFEPPEPLPPPVEDAAQEWEMPPVMETPPVRTAMEADTQAAILERQERLAEQMRELEAARIQQKRRAESLAMTAREERAEAAAVQQMRGSLLAELRHAPTARRSILLREILDKPVALR